jgi:type IV secretory pathway component VirB8
MLKFLSSKTFLKWFHACATIAWLLMIPIAVLTPLKDSVPFLVAISL